MRRTGPTGASLRPRAAQLFVHSLTTTGSVPSIDISYANTMDRPRGLFQQIQKRFLKHVQGKAVVAGITVGQVHHPVAVTPVQDLEGARVTLVRQGHQLLIVARVVVFCLQRGNAGNCGAPEPAIALVNEWTGKFTAIAGEWTVGCSPAPAARHSIGVHNSCSTPCELMQPCWGRDCFASSPRVARSSQPWAN